MKKLMLLLAAGALWLFLAAIPALADGGPHSIAHNSGFGTGSTLTSDSCAGCHRAHTGKGSDIIAASSEEALCLSCHGDAGTGATTDVQSGIQYAVVGSGSTARSGNILGALRGGGFQTARINSSDPYRVPYMRNATDVSFHTKVSVLASGQPVTSAHVVISGVNTVTTKMGTVWGNGDGSTAGYTSATTPFATECTSCHNPHGNGQYRILLPQPGDGTGPFTEAAAVTVTDAAAPPAGDVRNYTVIQTQGGTGTLLASQVAALPNYAPTMGDYFRRSVPWDPTPGGPYTTVPSSSLSSKDAPNGVASGSGAWQTQITAWCASCHTQYATVATTPSTTWQQTPNPSGSSIFMYRHGTTNNACTTCHVAHGSNAVMTGDGSTDYSGAFPYPDDTINSDGTNGFTSVSASSRLLKIDNRGTCQACHDPTKTVTASDTAPYNASGTLPTEYVP